MKKKKSDKMHIRFLHIFKPKKSMRSVELSILADNNTYFEYTLELRTSCLTKWVGRRIRSLFESFIIDKSTDVVVNPLLDENHLVYQYLLFLKQHIGFRLHVVPFDRVVSRVHFFFTHKKSKKRAFSQVWQETIDSKACPWITQSIEWQLQNKTEDMAQRTRKARLAMFYIVVKNVMK